MAGELTRAARILFVCGLIAGVAEFRLHPEAFGFGRGFEMAAIARSLVETGTFGNPFEPFVTGPTASNPPLYPLILAGLLKLFGPAGTVWIAVLVNIVLNAAIAAALPFLSRAVFRQDFPGVVAGALWIVSMRLMPQWDTTMTVAGLIAFCLISARGASAAVTGVLGGAISLLNPAGVLIFGPWLLYLRRGWRYVAAVVAMVAACNVPWIVRNYRAFGAPVLRTNFVYTLRSSNSDCDRSSLYETSLVQCYQRTHPAGDADEARLMTELGEVRFDRLRASEAFQWIREHPARFRELTLQRFVEFWFTDPGIAARAAYAMWLVTLLSIPGIVMMAVRREPVTWYILAVWLLYPLMFYVVVSCDRYRYPMLWASLLPAGYFVSRVVKRRKVS
jgi:hypothetical protein